MPLNRLFVSSFVAAVLLAAQTGTRYEYTQWDVFTNSALTGNQLAVFLDPKGLDARQMLALTRELGHSETSFVFPSDQPGTDFRLRIFGLNVPGVNGELEIAGHPTIGAVFAMAMAGRIRPGTRRVVVALPVGPTPVDLEWQDERLKFAWMDQRLPVFSQPVAGIAAVAAALGLNVDDIRSAGLPVQQVSCGAPFLLVPVASRAAVDRAVLDRNAMGAIIDAEGLARRGIFVFSLERGPDGADAYSRMLGFGVVEDPATGNASGPLGSYLVRHKLVTPERARHLTSRQGVKMGRPSEVHIAIDVEPESGSFRRVRIGGASMLAGEGALYVAAR